MEKTYERWGTQTMSQNYKIVTFLNNCAKEDRDDAAFQHKLGKDGIAAKVDDEAEQFDQAASLIQELAEAAERLATHLDERIDSAPRDAVPVFSGLAELRSVLSKLKEA